MNNLLAGAGKAEIVFPEEMLPIEGFYKIHDNPNVRILYLEKETKFVIAAFELVMLPDDLIETCKEVISELLHVEKEHIWIHVTHAITTPHSPGGPIIGPGGEVRPIPKEWQEKMNISIPRILEQREMYFKTIKDAVANACEEVSTSMRQARIGIGTGICDMNENRDIETSEGWWIGKGSSGYSNKEMTVIRMEDAEGHAIAGVISYGIKPCVIDNSQMREGKRQISSDLTGVACGYIEKEWNAPVLFLMSAAGDQIPKKMVLWDEVTESGEVIPKDLGVEQGFLWVEELGKKMSEDALEIGKNILCEDMEGDISCVNETFAWEGKARSEMRPTKVADYVAEREMKVPVGTVKMGSNLAFVSAKPELNAITEKELKEKSAVEHTLLVSMVDGGMKYMPDKASFEKVTWEALNSMLMPGAAEKYVEVAVQMLAE